MKTWRIGDVRITRIEESQGPGFTPGQLFADWDPAAIAPHLSWLKPGYLTQDEGQLITSIHAWLVQTPRHNILIDTCAGNHKERTWLPRFHRLHTPWLERLARAGVTCDTIDWVLCTHLHVDHVGWNTRLENGRWVPTFPKARYLFSRAEHDYWSPVVNPGILQKHPGKSVIYEDSVLPVVRSGQACIVDGAHAIDDWVCVEQAPGHTPGHLLVKLNAGGRLAVFSGDILHHPVQMLMPAWNSRFCELPDQARRTRRAVLDFCLAHDALLLPAHFAHPHVAQVEMRCGQCVPGFRFPDDGQGAHLP